MSIRPTRGEIDSNFQLVETRNGIQKNKTDRNGKQKINEKGRNKEAPPTKAPCPKGRLGGLTPKTKETKLARGGVGGEKKKTSHVRVGCN